MYKTEFQQELGRILANARNKRNLSQQALVEQFAQKFPFANSMSRPRYSRIELGRDRLDLYDFLCLATLLRIKKAVVYMLLAKVYRA